MRTWMLVATARSGVYPTRAQAVLLVEINREGCGRLHLSALTLHGQKGVYGIGFVGVIRVDFVHVTAAGPIGLVGVGEKTP